MKSKTKKRFEKVELDCAKCPISRKDCRWMTRHFHNPENPLFGEKWCPLKITMTNVLTFLEPVPKSKHS